MWLGVGHGAFLSLVAMMYAHASAGAGAGAGAVVGLG